MRVDKGWALITGACGGIGSALVKTFLENGYKVIGTDIQPPEQNVSYATRYLELDLKALVASKEHATLALAEIEKITEGVGISALVNNAAVQHLSSLKNIDRQSWQETLAVNLSAPLFLTQALEDSLAKNAGSVVNISSIHATQTKPEFLAYATSKAALSALTRSMAVDLGSSIQVNAIEPAAVATSMLQEGFAGKEQELARLGAYHPIGRIAQPVEVAELALFLCSDSARFIHGECISISGGIDRRLHDPE
ncbi:MAG: SDR family oxidoreductase [Halioglobus sp.]